MAKRHLERRLQIVVADFLRIAAPDDLIWFAIPMGELRTERTGALVKRMGAIPGVADLAFGLAGGRAAFIELKAPAGRLSPAQVAFRQACDRTGVLWAECRSLDEVIATLTGWGVKLRAVVA